MKGFFASILLFGVFFPAQITAKSGVYEGGPSLSLGIGIGGTTANSGPSLLYEPTLSIVFNDEEKKLPSTGIGIKASFQLMNGDDRGVGVALEGFSGYFGAELGAIFSARDDPGGAGTRTRHIGGQATAFLTWHRILSLYVRQTYIPDIQRPYETDAGLLLMLRTQDFGNIVGIFAYVLGGGKMFGGR